MIQIQATIYNISPFDAAIGTTIKFNWAGSQVFKNRCVIKDNASGATVYDNTVASFKLEHTIDLSKATLKNGSKYVAYITVFDKDDNESDLQSMGQIFLCLKTPVFKFKNIVDGQVLASSGYEFQLVYSQENNELLDSWAITIYDTTNTALSTSGIQYGTESPSYTFSGFENKREYKLRAIGKTVNGMALDTGFILVSILYQTAEIFSQVELENKPRLGAIQIRSNIISADGKLETGDPVYIDGKYIDLTNNTLTYDEGFLLEGDFSIVLKGYNLTPNLPFFEFLSRDNPNFKGTVTYRIGKLGSPTEMGVLELRITEAWYSYVIYSNKFTPVSPRDIVGFCLVRSDGYYNLEAKTIGSVL